jgi:hypothetical protein
MIKEENFMQLQYIAKERYMLATADRYKTEGEKQAAANAYIQGRVDTSADMESLVVQHNNMLKERNKLAAELAMIKGTLVSPPISGPKKGKEGYVQHIPAKDEGLGL